ncbi:FTS and Hook-interacting protein [Ornithorhynchus anatinus]|uniref:FTS and Hook-interacting protein n=1 Tax=Ornithorhynchus anatinus TaxID=9258 RepID=UPI0010A8E45F|nr:FTS and Hook-interacting protein [Ornithorhynchus anatinus]
MERMSWLSKLAPRSAGHRAPRGASLQTPVTADPETCLMVFKNHWAQVLRILEQRGPRPAPGGPDDASAVRNHTYQMLTLLAEDRPAPEAPPPGPLLDFALREDVLERVLRWQLQWDGAEERRAEQLKLYEMLISQARQPLLHHRAVREPLLRLLAACGPAPSPAAPAPAPAPSLDANLVLLLNQLCVCVAREPGLLELFLQGAPEPGPGPAPDGPPSLLLFSRLVPFIHREGPLGQQARDALLLLMALSAGNLTVGRYIADHSYFCPVLATGLSALYSSLPRKIEVRGDDWHFLRREDWLGVSPLALFMSSLEFCNAVTQVAHPLVQRQLVDYVHNGFLVPVMGPALHKSSVEEMIASTAYLELFVRSVSEPALLRTFLRFLLLHRHDSHTILDTLVARIASNSRLCMVSLSLFRTLLNLNCEDVLLQLVLRYLVPCNHVMLSQKRAVRDVDLYGRAADKFLSLIPRCCRHRPPSPPPPGPEEHAGRARGPDSPGVDLSSAVTVPRPSTPSRLALFLRQQSLGPGEPAGPAPRSPGLAASPGPSPGHRPGPGAGGGGGALNEEPGELEGNYLEYLREARLGVDRCVRACRSWSAPYDGERPPPGPGPRTKKRSLREGQGEGREEEEEEEQQLGGLGGAGGPLSLEAGDSSHLPPPPQLNGVPEAAKKVCRGPGALEEELPLAGGGPGAGGLEGFGRELRELEAALRNGGNGLLELPPDPPPGQGEEEEEEEETAAAYGSFTAQPEVEPPGHLLGSPLHTPSQVPSQPFTGPFVAVLFAKLENMLQNSLYVNFLLTGLLAQLACHPQPLLRSFLLNTNMVFQPSVKSLIQVLGSVKNKIESFAAMQEDFPVLLSKAKKYLIARGRLDWAEGPGAPPALRRTDALAKSRKPSLGELLLRHAQSPTRARQAAQLALQHMREGPVLQALAGPGPPPAPPAARGPAERQSEALRVKNAVYCAVIFPEFLKELAAISQAHAVTSPFLLDAPEE